MPDSLHPRFTGVIAPLFTPCDETGRLDTDGLRLESTGVIGQGCCLYPELLDVLRERFLSGNTAGAERAQADVHRALRAFDGLDAVTAGEQYLIRQGVRMLLYDRSGTLPYPDEVIARLEAVLKW